MVKNATEILREMEAEIASLKERLQVLEDKLTEYQTLAMQEEEPDPVEATPVDFTDMEIGTTEEPVPEDVPESIPESVLEDLPVEMEIVPELVPESVSEPTPEPEPEPEPDLEPAQVPALDPEMTRLPWYSDTPGLSVKNIRSGISLYDRALFIGTLFKEDFTLYDRTIAELNVLESLDAAVAYLVEHFPDWNFRSDIVYNFMMAIRKKLG